jgi:hypothetical protein
MGSGGRDDSSLGALVAQEAKITAVKVKTVNIRITDNGLKLEYIIII